MSLLDDLLIFHNLTSPNVNGHFELSLPLSILNHAWLRPRAVLEKFAAVQMLDVHIPTPTTTGRSS